MKCHSVYSHKQKNEKQFHKYLTIQNAWICFKFKDRHMRFTVISLFNSKIDILELNLRTPIDMTKWHVFTDKSLPFSCSNRCGKVNIEMQIDWRTVKQTLPQLQFCITNPGSKKYCTSISSFNDIQYSISSHFLFSAHTVFKLNKVTPILQIWFCLRDMYRRFRLT
jgi:hypothetical protein